MQPRMKLAFLASSVEALAACAQMSSMSPQPMNPMSFFVTSANPGFGANLGGLAGADAYCPAAVDVKIFPLGNIFYEI